ncbi:MAG: hypothetical protein GC162_04230 [Planctomycetes bacterium]|nr:hypothetical protein [Planctomycetota bacterium]
MGWRRTKSRTAIGLDVGARLIKAVQMVGKRGSWQVAAAASFERSSQDRLPDQAELSRLAEVLDRQGFTGRQIVLAVPDDKLLSGILELPPRDSGAPVEQIARMELASMHRVDPQSFELSYWELPETSRARETARVMAAACAHNDAEELMDLFENAGFEVVALDTSAGAIARVCDMTHEGNEAIRPVLDIGWRAARLVVLFKGVDIYERQLTDAGVKSLWESLASRLELESDVVDYLLTQIGLNDDPNAETAMPLDDLHQAIREHFESMVHELGISFSYALHQYNDAAITSLTLVGGGASIPGLADHLSKALDMPVKLLTPGQQATCPPSLMTAGSTGTLTSAMGLALHTREAKGK